METGGGKGGSGGMSKKGRGRGIRRQTRTTTSIDVDGVEQSKMRYDSTGMYHWCPSRDIEASLMDRQDAAMTVLQVGQDQAGKEIRFVMPFFRISPGRIT